MKKKITFLFFLIILKANSQVPQSFNYQGVARDNSGSPIANQTICLRLSILDNSTSGNVLYMETHAPGTNQFGLFTVALGSGTSVIGNFSTISWGTGNTRWLRVELDDKCASSPNYKIVGITQFLTVPYAMYAEKSGSGGGSSYSGGSGISISGNIISNSKPDVPITLKDSGSIKISGTYPKFTVYSPGSNSGWSLNGNKGTDSNSFIGTTDKQPLVIKVNNERAGFIDSLGSNTFLGYQAGKENSTGSSNVFIGTQAGYRNTTRNGSVFIGYLSGFSTQSGQCCDIFIGPSSGYSNSTGFDNIFIGGGAGYNNTTANSNHFIGHQAGLNTTTGSANTFFGHQAGYSNTTAGKNTFIGFTSGHTNTTGYNNSFFGHYSGFNNSTGMDNTFIGVNAGFNTSTGHHNSAIGSNAMNNVTTGEANVAIGYTAGSSISTGSFNTCIGTFAETYNTNTIVLAANGNLVPTGDNQARIGNNSMSSIGGQVSWTSLSDERIKKNVKEDIIGLPFIMKLKPVTYNFSISKTNQLIGKKDSTNWPTKYDIERIRFSGFFAQDVEKVALSLGYSFSGVDKPQDPNGLWGLRYSEFVVPLVKGMQEQQEMIESLSEQIKLMQQEIEELKSLVLAKTK